MAIIDRPAPDEPEERPDQLGRHLLKIKAQYPGQWREAFESHNRSHAVRVEGCLIGRGAGRIAGVTDIEGWEARLVVRHEADKELYVVRVRYTAPREKGPNELVAEAKAEHPAGKGHDAPGPEAGRVDPAKLPPRDPEEAAQAGLDLAAG